MNQKNILFVLIALQAFTFYSAAQSTNDTIDIDEVVVTGSRVETTRKNVAMSVSVISKQQIDRAGETSAVLPIISQQVPGVFVSERGITGFGVAEGSAGHISIRGIGGFPNSQVLLLIDGHPQYMGLFGHPLPDAYVASDIEKVEVIRGPASILYGSNAMGGAINLITKKQKQEGLSLNGRLSYGSFNTQKYMGNIGFRKKGFSVFASLNHDRTDGHRDNSDFKITNGYFKTGYEINTHWQVLADINIADFESNNPGPEFETEYGIFNVDIQRGKTSLSIDNKYKKVEGAIKAFHNFGEHNLSNGFHSTDNNTGIMAYQGLKLLPNNTITLGVDYKNYGGEAENKKFGKDFGRHSEREMAAYAFVQQIIKKQITLNGGIRLENHSVFGNEIIPHAGFSWHPLTNTSIKGSVSKGYRSPTIMELYLFMPEPQEHLKPERVMSYETGIEQVLVNGKLRFELTGYFMKGNNLIQETYTPKPQRINTGSFEHWGVEVAAKYNPMENLNINVNYSYLNTDKKIAAAPEHQLYAHLHYSWKTIGFNVNVQQINDLYPYNETDYVEGYQAVDYTLLNAKIIINTLKPVSFFISGRNLLNQDYAINFGYPMPGATFNIGASINMHFFDE